MISFSYLYLIWLSVSINRRQATRRDSCRSKAVHLCDKKRHNKLVVVFNFHFVDGLSGVFHEAFYLKWMQNCSIENYDLTSRLNKPLKLPPLSDWKQAESLDWEHLSKVLKPIKCLPIQDNQSETSRLTIVLNIVDLNVVPLMGESLRVQLHSVVVFGLLQEMSVQGGDVYDVSVDNNNESFRTLSLYKRLWTFSNQTFSDDKKTYEFVSWTMRLRAVCSSRFGSELA